MELDFYQPNIVPAGIKKIVIVGKQMDYTNYTSAKVLLQAQGTEENPWYKGCENHV
jgi:hypothetical protein